MSRKHTVPARRSRLGFESLETRSLLSGLHASAAIHAKSDDHHPAIVAGSSTSAAKTTSTSTVSSTDHGSQQNETHLVAALAPPAGTAGSATGIAKFESETEHGVAVSKFFVNVKGAPAGATLDVSIGSVKVGQVLVAKDGAGQLTVKTNLPATTAGSIVSLTDSTDPTKPVEVLNGAFTAPTTASGGSHDDGGVQNETHLAASFVDPANAAFSGLARFESQTEHGVVVSELSIRVKGAPIEATIDVTVPDATGAGTFSLGTIKVGADGTGKLVLASNPHGTTQQPIPVGFPGVSAGTKVTLTTNNNGSMSTISSVLAVPASKKSK